MKVYKASAGSGKTYRLAVEYIKELLIKPTDFAHRHILAVTFTKDATGEMKDRILAELYGLASGCSDSEGFMQSVQEALSKEGKPMQSDAIQIKSGLVLQAILHDYSRLYITTIDSFFQKVLRNLARELGKSSRFNLEMNSSKVLSEAVNTMVEKANQNPQLLDWLTTYIEEKLDDAGNWRITKEILDFSRCIFDEYFQEHEEILKKQLAANPKIFEQLLTEHNKIQKNSKIFFRNTYMGISKIMEEQQYVLSDFNRSGTVINFFRKLSEGDTSVKTEGVTLKDCCLEAGKWPSAKSKRREEIIRWAESDLMLLLNESLDELKRFNTSRMITKNIHQLGLIWDITKEIEQQNAENNRFMLADTALFLNKMIDDSDSPFIYEKIGAEIKHVMIDEFQDTSRLQWKNFKALLSNILASDYFSLLVGDVKQSIYRWRNGDWSILNGIEKEIKAEIETLDYNYRSEAEIIDFNNHFFTHAATLLNKKYYELFANLSDSPFISAYAPKNVVQYTPKKENRGYVSIDFLPDKKDDIKYNELVLEEIILKLQLLKNTGIAPEQICILTRTNKNIIGIAEYLASQKEKYPELSAYNYLNVVSNEAFQLNSSPAIQILIEAMRVLADWENPIHKAQLKIFLNRVRRIDFPVSEAFSNNQKTETIHYAETIELLSERNPLKVTTLPLFELIGYLFRIFNLEAIEGQSNYMFALYDAVNNYLKDYPADIFSFLKYWDDELQFKSIPASTTVEGVRAMTIHKSKGLQFHTVLLPYCDWDLYPEKNPVVWCTPKPGLYELELLPVKYSHKMFDTIFLPEYESETRQSWMDNLNVLYVAFTRAEHNLLVISNQKKKLDSSGDIKTVSDLLQYAVPELNGFYDAENMRFEKGILQTPLPEEEKMTDNILKKVPEILDISFVTEAFNSDKTIFKQSNKSRAFISKTESTNRKNEYIKRGNLMHKLFASIDTIDDIEKSVEQLCFEGLISTGDKQKYVDFIRGAILESGHSDWFSGLYQTYNECTILSKENGAILSHRPDKVLIRDHHVIILDYKFGEPHPSHQKQIQCYTDLMRQMGYAQVESHLWYIDSEFFDRHQ